MKRITFDRPNKNFNFFYGFISASMIAYSLLLMSVSYGTPVTPYNGYIMKFNGEKVKVVQDVQAEEPPEITFEEYVQEKFGKDAWKAFALLKGTKYCGGENKTLNPEASNTAGNTPEGSVDRGYWQFNSHWHPEVSDNCVKDIKCSTDRAYEMFKKDGSFKQWSSGKCIGI